MRTAVISIIVAFLSAAGGVAGALIAARHTMLAGLYRRIAQVEKDENECREEVFDLRQEMQSLYFINDILAQHCPDMDERVREVRERIARRREKYEVERLGDEEKLRRDGRLNRTD